MIHDTRQGAPGVGSTPYTIYIRPAWLSIHILNLNVDDMCIDSEDRTFFNFKYLII